MNKRSILLYLFFIPILLFGFEIIDDQLYLDILLQESSSVKIYGEAFQVQEHDSPFIEDFSGTYQLEISSHSTNSFYVVSAAKQFEDSYVTTKSNLIYQNNKIQKIEQISYISNESFTSKDEAIEFKETNNLIGDIIQKSENLSELKLFGEKSCYFSLPCRIIGKISININDEYQTFNGAISIYSKNGKIQVVARTELQKYLFGVVGNELGNSSNLEALKAQAVAARTKAIKTTIKNYTKDGLFDLDATTSFQVFKSSENYAKNIVEAVNQTEGEIITYKSEIIDAVFSSCCGGKTEDSSNIWSGKQLPYLKSIYDGMKKIDLTQNSNAKKWIKKTSGAHCAYSPKSKNWEKKLFNWEKTISNESIARKANLSKIKKIEILKRGKSGRIIELKISGNESSKILSNQSEIRHFFGSARSSFFYIKSIGDNIVIEGKGSGHGVGMCQTGMLNQVRAGKNYRDALLFYYKGCRIEKVE